MINFPNGGILVQAVSELPNLVGCSDIVLDFETTSGDDKLDSLNPWFHCDVAGICITADEVAEAWYVPLGHRRETAAERNLEASPAIAWLRDVIASCKVITGHNVKYDAHVLCNALGINHRLYGVELYDTLTQAKLIDSERLSFSLDDLSRDWVGEDISEYENAFRAYLYDGRGNRICKDYGTIPIRILAEYGCQDVLTTRLLKKYIQKKLPVSCSIVSNNEQKLTNVLFDIENNGMVVNPQEVQVTKLKTLCRLNEIIYRINDLTGVDMRPNVTDDCYNFLCVENGLPVLEWTNEKDANKVSNPSFNKKAMKSYLVHPRVQSTPHLKESVELIAEYRTLHTFDALFLNTYLHRNLHGILHSSYNQCVRTGRLSCSDPNAQQLSKLAKSLILVPDDEWILVDIDLAQIEFRLIASTINNAKVIEEYRVSPETDYHQLVADLAGLERSPAKNLNFAVGFRAGKKKTIEMVKGSLDITSQGFKDSGMVFDEYCQMRAETMYSEYHRMLPELKSTMQRAEDKARHYGYIANLYHRRRHLSGRGCYKGFNAYIQSSAADIAKDLTLQIADYISSLDQSGLVKLIGVVHDSWIFYMHKSVYRKVIPNITRIIESVTPPNPVRVPILCSVETSETNWKECEPYESN